MLCVMGLKEVKKKTKTILKVCREHGKNMTCVSLLLLE